LQRAGRVHSDPRSRSVTLSASHPTAPTEPVKPAKPYPEFPLSAHAVGQWARKIKGKLYYFGAWDNPDAALKKYLEQKRLGHGLPTVPPGPTVGLPARNQTGDLRSWPGHGRETVPQLAWDNPDAALKKYFEQKDAAR